MARHTSAMSLLSIFLMFFVAAPAGAANTLSNTYYTAFASPYTFDNLLNRELSNDPNYYSKFERCSQIAPPALVGLERQLNQEYSVCPNNARCTQVATDIQTVTQLEAKVKALITYIDARRRNSQLRFVDTDVGKAAVFLYNFHRNNGIDIRNNPVFIQEVGILGSVPCQ